MSIISRSGGITDQFTFTGGVAKNEAAVRELRKLVEENYGSVISGVLAKSRAFIKINSPQSGDSASGVQTAIS